MNLHRALKLSRLKVKRLQTKVDKLIAEELVHLSDVRTISSMLPTKQNTDEKL